MQFTRTNNYNIALSGLSGAVFLCLCIFFQSNNSTIDAYGFAADIKYGENLFRPHHLLYNALGYMLSKVFTAMEPLALMKMVNSIFALVCIWSLYAIMQLLKFNNKFIYAACLIIASSFGLLRFATENEVYIIPVFFSLWGTYYFIKYNKSKNVSVVILSAILLSIAALFHQMHILWLLVTAFYFLQQRARAGIVFLVVSGFIIIGTYLLAVLSTKSVLDIETITRFVFNDYYSGEASNTINASNFYLTGINLIRSFVQVHGNILLLIKLNYYYIIPILVCIILLAMQVKIYSKDKTNHIKPKSESIRVKRYIFSALVIHTLFALYAQGNAEFMVMIPILILIYIGFYVGHQSVNYIYMGIAMLIWNISFGLIPQKYYDLQNKSYILTHYDKNNIYILQQANLYKNIFYYLHQQNCDNIYKAPSDYKNKNQDYTFLETLIEQKLADNSLILTDAINNADFGSRRAMLSGDFDKVFFSKYHSVAYYIDSNSLKTYHITQIQHGK